MVLNLSLIHILSDFRVRDMAAGGLGAPLVPYTEYLLYQDPQRNVALQNIGGIGNITLLPRGAGLNGVLAFDTGPGNMVIDALAARMTNGKARYDDGGKKMCIRDRCGGGEKKNTDGTPFPEKRYTSPLVYRKGLTLRQKRRLQSPTG